MKRGVPYFFASEVIFFPAKVNSPSLSLAIFLHIYFFSFVNINFVSFLRASFYEAPSACRIYVGGTWGKKQRMGTLLKPLYTFEEIPSVIEKVMLWFKENGFVKERLGAAIDRVGVGEFEKAIEGDDLFERKEEILAAPMRERA